jgi:multidrug transporter EmrE-like cation transporter
MTPATFALLLTGVLLNALAQLLLKAGANTVGPVAFSPDSLLSAGMKFATEPHIFGGLLCYAISVVVWIVALTRVEVSVAYPMLSIGYVVNAFAAWALFNEQVTPMRLLGIGIIILGVWIVARS